MIKVWREKTIPIQYLDSMLFVGFGEKDFFKKLIIVNEYFA